MITLGVDDLGRALAFYRDGLGLASKGIIGQEFECRIAFVKSKPWRRSSAAPR